MKSLAVLIPTLPERRLYYTTIYNHLSGQIGERDIRIIPDQRGKQLSIGIKRQQMLEACTSDYVVFVDDDDMVSHDYIERIYDAIQSEPDVVGLCGHMTTDSRNPEKWCIRTKYDWAENQDGYRYVRYPNHLAPIKREHALAAGFADMRHGEDYQYSMRLKELGILKTEVFIDAELYFYHFRTRRLNGI